MSVFIMIDKLRDMCKDEDTAGEPKTVGKPAKEKGL